MTSIFGFAKRRSWRIFEARKLGAAVDDVDLGRVAGEVVGFFDRGVATAHDRDDFVLEEGAVAHRAVGDAAAGKLELARNTELAGVSRRR